MRVIIEFDTDNAAFEDDLSTEVKGVLSDAATTIESGHAAYARKKKRALPYSDYLYDSNGNTIGKVEVRS